MFKSDRDKMSIIYTHNTALFGSLVPAMCNRTSCAKVHELPQSHYGDIKEQLKVE